MIDRDFSLYKHIVIDVQESWPLELVNLLKDSKENLMNYLEEEKSIDEAAIENVLLRMNRPMNKYQQGWDELITRIKSIISKYKFIGFHCTRLTKEEVTEVLLNGLKPLNEELLSKKLNVLLDLNFIDSDEYHKMLVNEQVNEEGRKDKVFTFHEIHTLTDESGLKRLFRCWGGEYFYYGNEEKRDFRDKYFHIGKATILITSHQYEDVQHRDIEIKMIKNFLFYNTDYRGNDFDNWHHKPVKVLNYIDEDSDLFYDLTGYRTWTI